MNRFGDFILFIKLCIILNKCKTTFIFLELYGFINDPEVSKADLGLSSLWYNYLIHTVWVQLPNYTGNRHTICASFGLV